jgi:hypothetical protein
LSLVDPRLDNIYQITTKIATVLFYKFFLHINPPLLHTQKKTAGRRRHDARTLAPVGDGSRARGRGRRCAAHVVAAYAGVGRRRSWPDSCRAPARSPCRPLRRANGPKSDRGRIFVAGKLVNKHHVAAAKLATASSLFNAATLTKGAFSSPKKI